MCIVAVCIIDVCIVDVCVGDVCVVVRDQEDKYLQDSRQAHAIGRVKTFEWRIGRTSGFSMTN